MSHINTLPTIIRQEITHKVEEIIAEERIYGIGWGDLGLLRLDTKPGCRNTSLEESLACILQKCYAATRTICLAEKGKQSSIERRGRPGGENQKADATGKRRIHEQGVVRGIFKVLDAYSARILIIYFYFFNWTYRKGTNLNIHLFHSPQQQK